MIEASDLLLLVLDLCADRRLICTDRGNEISLLSTVMQKCTKSGHEKCTTLPGTTWQPSRVSEEVAMITEEANMDIWALHREGHSMRYIARKLGLHRNTVKKHIVGKRLHEYRRSGARRSLPAPFVRMIQDWLSQDSYQASWVFERLKSTGKAGGLPGEVIEMTVGYTAIPVHFKIRTASGSGMPVSVRTAQQRSISLCRIPLFAAPFEIPSW